MTESTGHKFAEAIARKDAAALTALLTPELDFRALTPRKFWEATDPAEVVEIVFGNWFEEQDHIEGVEITEGDPVADTQQVGYRLALSTPDGPHVAEQQAYYRVDGDRISYLRVLCSGFRPVSSPVYDEGE
jgi:ketosteroid isomerase-like protein